MWRQSVSPLAGAPQGGPEREKKVFHHHVLAVGDWRLAVGDWRLVAFGGRGLVVDGGWQWLAVGGWSPLAVGSRRLVPSA